MSIIKSILGAVALAGMMLAQPALAAGEAIEIEKQPWTFAGVFGTYDQNQLQRGFQVYQNVCAACHGMRLMAFRNLSEPGGPRFSEEQVKALAATFEIPDESAEGGVRPGIAADRWPSPFASDREAAEAMGGKAPPDLSVMAKARGTSQPFPWWILNYVTPYAEGGPDYMYALLTGYEEEVPEGVVGADGQPLVLGPGLYYNHVYPGHAIAMAPPLADGSVTYENVEGVAQVPETVEQYSRDVSAFLMWVAEPHLVARKEAGLRVILFLILFAGLLYAVKRRIWAKAH